MGNGHGHDHARAAGGNRVRLAIALGITLLVLVAEVVGAVLSGSLALLGDAGHMSSDAIGLAVALAASVVAARPATDRHTFGFQRMEVLAALAN
ncbi:cation transporter, partial [Schumannella luteola]